MKLLHLPCQDHNHGKRNLCLNNKLKTKLNFKTNKDSIGPNNYGHKLGVECIFLEVGFPKTGLWWREKRSHIFKVILLLQLFFLCETFFNLILMVKWSAEHWNGEFFWWTEGEPKKLPISVRSTPWTSKSKLGNVEHRKNQLHSQKTLKLRLSFVSEPS